MHFLPITQWIVLKTPWIYVPQFENSYLARRVQLEHPSARGLSKHGASYRDIVVSTLATGKIHALLSRLSLVEAR